MDEDQQDELLFQVRGNTLDDQVWVLIPPKYWQIENISEMIKMAVDMVISESEQGSPPNETH